MSTNPKICQTSRLTIDEDAMSAFARLSGDENPIHVDDDGAQRFGFPRRVAYAGILLAEISRIIGVDVPGPGALCLSWRFDFKAPVYVSEQVLFETTLAHRSHATGAVALDFVARRESDGATVLAGSATVRVLEEGASS